MSPALGTVPPSSSGIYLAWWSAAQVSTAWKDAGTESSYGEAGFAELDGSPSRFFGRNPGSEQVSAELESCLGVIPAAPHQQTFDLLPWRHYPGVAGPQCLC